MTTSTLTSCHGRLAALLLLLTTAATAGESLAAEAEGIYMVPQSQFLAAAVEAPTNKARFRLRPSGAELVYDLPQVLDGVEPQRFVLRGTIVGDSYYLSGSGATAVCPAVNPEDGCTITYMGLNLQEEAAEDFLAASTLSDAEKQTFRSARVALMRQGVGVLRSRLID